MPVRSSFFILSKFVAIAEPLHTALITVNPFVRNFAAEVLVPATVSLRLCSFQPTRRLRFRAALILRPRPISLTATSDTCWPIREVVRIAILPTTLPFLPVRVGFSVRCPQRSLATRYEQHSNTD